MKSREVSYVLIMESWHFCISHFATTTFHMLFSVWPVSCHGKEKGEGKMTSENRRGIVSSVLGNLSKAQVPLPYSSLMCGNSKFFFSCCHLKNNNNSSLQLINT